MTDRPDIPERDAILAAELALSLLEGEERAEAERRLLTDPAFRSEALAWQEGLADLLADEIAEVPVRPQVKDKLMARLFDAPARRVWPWRVFGLGSFAAAVALAVIVALPMLTAPKAPTQDLAAFNVAADDGSLVLLAALDRATRMLYFTRVAGAPAPGRAFELWAIQGGNPPVSLGVLPEGDTGTARIPPGIGSGGLTLAISDEPAGGSPTGAPTGDILAAGQLVEL